MKPNRQRTRHHMTKSTSSLNNHQATLPVRGARPLPPWKEVFPPSFSPMGITAECFPFLLNVYPGGHGGGVISEVQWAKTAACTFLPTPDRWTLSMSVMSVLLTHTKAAPLALAELLLKFTPPLPKKDCVTNIRLTSHLHLEAECLGFRKEELYWTQLMSGRADGNHIMQLF